MAFKLKPKYSCSSTPVYHVNLGDGIAGKANNNGSILINQDIDDVETREHVINHEDVHIDQMQRGDLNYDKKYVYWKGKKFPRSKMKEGAKNLPWEAEAYKKAK